MSKTNHRRQTTVLVPFLERSSPAPAENLEASESKSSWKLKPSSSRKIGPVEMMTQVLYIVSSVATVNTRTLEKRVAQPAHASRSTSPASKMDDLTGLLLLSAPFLNSMVLILIMWKLSIANITA